MICKSREILFRGKRIDNGEWVYGFYVREEGLKRDGFHSTSHTIITKREPFRLYQDRVYADTVGQYTGLKDRNGAKIFDGDIVVAFKGEDCEEVNAVFYNANHCKWFLGSPYNNKLPMGLGEFWWLDLEVIGNIHDNPELLEV